MGNRGVGGRWFGALAVFAFIAAGLVGSSGTAFAQEDPIAIAGQDGVQLVMRHAIAPGTGDPANFDLGDCSTQRTLSDEGREQARAIGRLLRDAAIKVDVILTSQWCRCRETAELLDVGPVEEAPFLNSFFRDRSRSDAQTAAARERLRELAESGRKAILVTHQVNITALSGVYPSSGEIVLVGTGEDGAIGVRGRLKN